MDDDINGKQVTSITQLWGVEGARRVAQQAQVYYYNINRDAQFGTQGFFTIISTLLGLASGLTAFASGVRANTHPPELNRLQIYIRNLTRFTMVITDNHGSNSRISPAPRIMPGETLDYLYAVGRSLPNNGQDMLSFSLIPVNEQRSAIHLRVAITDNGSHVHVSRVTLNGSIISNTPLPSQSQRDISNIFYYVRSGGTDAWVSSSILTNGIEGKLDLTILSPS